MLWCSGGQQWPGIGLQFEGVIIKTSLIAATGACGLCIDKKWGQQVVFFIGGMFVYLTQ